MVNLEQSKNKYMKNYSRLLCMIMLYSTHNIKDVNE